MIKRKILVHVTFAYKYACIILIENIKLLKIFETTNCFF